jgi:hypothetical protein
MAQHARAAPLRACTLVVFAALLLQAAPACARCSLTTPCANNATCDIHGGGCACLLGYGGPLCEALLYPACRPFAAPGANDTVAFPPPMRCAHVDVKHCQCYRECATHPVKQDWSGAAPCFESADGLSSFPAAADGNGSTNATTTTYWSDFRADSRAAAARSDVVRAFVDPALCGGCNNEGLCVERPARPAEPGSRAEHACACYLGFRGAHCEHVRPWACFNACSGNGTCIRGQCACRPGFFGIDCSIDLRSVSRERWTAVALDDPSTRYMEDEEEEAAAAANSSAARVGNLSFATRTRVGALKIYIYELPAWLNLEVILDMPAGHVHMNHDIYNGYHIFLERLLHDWSVRTLDAAEADFFYVPTFGYGVGGNGGSPAAQTTRVLNYIRARYPQHFLRAGGADHIFWAVNDFGLCPMPPELSHLLWVELWGLTHAEWDKAEQEDGVKCFNPARGIVAAAYEGHGTKYHGDTYGVPYNQAADVPFPRGAAAAPRDTFFYFSGSYSFGDLHYSQGVRQAVWHLFRNASGFVVMERDAHGAENAMRKSVFCLTPAGSGWGHRLTYAMLSGCVPVIIMDSVVQPGQDVLPYGDFSVQLSRSQVPQLARILRDITPPELRALQDGVARHSSYFVWDLNRSRFEETNHGGIHEKSAYGLILKSLYHKKSMLHALLG